MKNIAKLKNQCTATQWYKQASAVRPLYIGFPWGACYEDFTIFHKPSGHMYHGMVIFATRDYFDVYFPKKLMEEIAGVYNRRQARDSRFVSALKKNWKKTDVQAFSDISNELLRDDFSELSDRGLLQKFSAFCRVYNRLWKEAIFLDAFDVMSEPILEQAVSKSGLKITERDMHTLTAAEEFSWIQREKISLIKLAGEAKKNSRMQKFIRARDTQNLQREFPSFFHKLSTHAQSFHWIQNDYATIKWLDEKYFLNELSSLLKNNQLKKELQNLSHVTKARSLKKHLIQKLRLPDSLVKTTDYLLCLASWRDSRKAYNQKAGNVLQKFAAAFAGRSGVKTEHVERLFWWEIPGAFGKTKIILQLSNARTKKTFYTGHPSKRSSIITGAPAAALYAVIERAIAQSQGLRGKTAFPGTVTGTVKIIRNQQEFHKMRRGDILVAPNTRPEYVPVMKLASAIITVEGGITSHAAIVSRELKIPCIVGVQSALQKLKDGNKIKIDATKGTIELAR